MPFTLNAQSTSKLCLLAGMAILIGCAGAPPTKRQVASSDIATPAMEQGFAIGKIIDETWAAGKHQELQEVRTGQPGYVDACVTDLKESNTFSERIGYFVHQRMTPRIVEHYVKTGNDPIDVYQLFDIPKTDTLATGLMSHVMCIDTEASFQAQLTHVPMKPVITDNGTFQKDEAGKYVMVPDAETLQLAQKFETLYNTYRTSALGTKDSTQLQGLWVRLMDCLAYSESLDGPNSGRADLLAQKYRPIDEAGEPSPKPLGVEFYMDTTPDPKVRQLTIGLFQFTPGAVANQYPCATAWNEEYPSCKVDPSNSKTHTWALSSPYQTYNAFCGTDKIVESFFTQVNATTAKRTNLLNISADGTLKAPQDRCVTPFFKANLTFNHFGPLQNSFQNQQLSNLKKALTCAVGDL
jgi:hypothetical protein